MNTIVYIDGYNLFYGRLQNTSFKWLDIFKLFQSIAKVQDPSSNIIQIKYFTAPVRANFASHGRDSVTAQNTYHRALNQVYQQQIEIISGYHTVEKGTPPRYSKPIDKDNRVEIWKFEEKQTDVNIALAMYRDAMHKSCEQQILVSNDSDLVPALKLINSDVQDIKLGLIIPRKKPESGQKVRPPNKSLSDIVDWTRSYILDEECRNSQLADKIPTNKKPILKPGYW
ncbi:MAG: NYN domain-containing protein [Gammaproteobacteria bacterium]|nr:MAG: NYN domain-containing protein [Gammaproteobacteria bacterium]